MNIDEFMSGLDELYEKQKYDQVEKYLLNGLTVAGDSEEALVILNDLMGYYRAVSRHEDMVRGAEKVLNLINKMKLEDTISHGTSLLNIATGYRAAGKYEESEIYYQKAKEIFERCIKGPDYRVATLYNNLGLLYMEIGRPDKAQKCSEKALEITLQLSGADAELASTYANLGNVYFTIGKREEAEKNMKKAVELYEKLPGNVDSHYPAALSGLGQTCFIKGDLEESVAYYEKARKIIEFMYGRNDDWNTIDSNIKLVKELIVRRDAIRRKNMKGIELSKAYYDEVGVSLIENKYKAYAGRIATGLAGEGSECMGYDDDFSTDHDYGPGFCIWLTREDFDAFGHELQMDYNELPKEWSGMPARNTSKEGEGRVGVLCIDDFFKKYTGFYRAPEVKNIEDVLAWDAIKTEQLCNVVNGKVFRDDLGEFTKRREEFKEYPKPVRLYKIANALHRMAQSGQYNYDRSIKRDDVGMMYSSISEFVDATVECAYLLNNMYMPFYKWRFRGMDSFTCLTNLKDLLERVVLKRPNDKIVRAKIEEICKEFVEELHKQNLSRSNDEFLDVHKDEVFEKMEECFDKRTEKEKLVDAIVEAEWNQFQYVENEGGRASCQDNYATFRIMRVSQFLAWDMPVLESYLSDLKEGEKTGWNLITEKYARMMEHTSPLQYVELEKHLPKLNNQRIMLQEALVDITAKWTLEVDEQYPNLAKLARNRYSSEDTKWNTSSETYFRGEISTYSDYTLKLYTVMVQDALRVGRNIVKDILENTVHMYGYESMSQANEAYEK